MHQTMIPTKVVIKERAAPLPEAIAQLTSTSTPATETATQPQEQGRRIRPHLDKEEDFLEVNLDEPVKEVLEALPLETVAVALIHQKY